MVVVECLARTVAVDTAVLSPLFCEKDLALPGRDRSQPKVHKSLVEASSAARAAAEGNLAGLDATSQNIANVFRKKSHFLLSQNKHFHIEMRFFAQSSGALGLLRVQDMILDLLPTEQKLLDAARSVASFQRLQTAGVLEFASMGARSLFNTVMALVRSIAEQSVPNVQGATDTDFFMEVKRRLTFFAQVKANDFTDGTVREFCGWHCGAAPVYLNQGADRPED